MKGQKWKPWILKSRSTWLVKSERFQNIFVCMYVRTWYLSVFSQKPKFWRLWMITCHSLLRHLASQLVNSIAYLLCAKKAQTTKKGNICLHFKVMQIWWKKKLWHIWHVTSLPSGAASTEYNHTDNVDELQCPYRSLFTLVATAIFGLQTRFIIRK